MQELIDQSKAEQQRLRRQRLQAEREERERERQAKLESEQVELKKIAKLDAEKAAAAKEAVRSNMLVSFTPSSSAQSTEWVNMEINRASRFKVAAESLAAMGPRQLSKASPSSAGKWRDWRTAHKRRGFGCCPRASCLKASKGTWKRLQSCSSGPAASADGRKPCSRDLQQLRKQPPLFGRQEGRFCCARLRAELYAAAFPIRYNVHRIVDRVICTCCCTLTTTLGCCASSFPSIA